MNKLRDNRIKNNVALTATDKDEALRIVLDERRQEFAFTGFHRLIDLKRLNYEDKFKKPSPIRQTAKPLPLHRTTIGTSSRLIK
ncbi:MAG: RagB/SusD family nutrient uptake outer membrane protein [Odoribacter splanchnicus]